MIFIEDKYMSLSDLNLVKAYQKTNTFYIDRLIDTGDKLLAVISNKIAADIFDTSPNILFEL